ncbi:hypothetical protein PHAVU_004G061200 [Phaseolus vulgaris]|uniref:Uncharacterized protein n=2 Tax=Phaseolus vulgaris TaxID=3885 RepID=V7C2S0_PHAVU|nr:hypothetical protein PHAVU_004G061200g [Phaseolus vulgaris]ESW23600.1 hypothetical protein PHAVU_004G061200g [Phaseolus vulgaris]
MKLKMKMKHNNPVNHLVLIKVKEMQIRKVFFAFLVLSFWFVVKELGGLILEPVAEKFLSYFKNSGN